MSKTAMQELKDGLQTDVQLSFLKQKDVDRINWYIDTYYIPKEKQNIIEAWNNSTAATSTDDTGEDYYNQKYQTP